MQTSSNSLIVELFPPVDINSKKRPLTAGIQFKNALGDLMTALLACQPHYIRCIKPNDKKQGGIADNEIILHQVRYLGLLENVRVRCAGFAYRQVYERFLWRYKMITNETWPRWRKDAKSGTVTILNAFNIGKDEFRLGKTKIFIKNPTTLFFLEEKREAEMPKVVTRMQAAWRGYQARSKWAKRKAAIKILLFYRQYKWKRWLYDLEKTFRDVKRDPQWGKFTKWPVHPPVLKTCAMYMHRIHNCWRAVQMVNSLTPEQQAAMRQKVLALTIFKGHKPWKCGRIFDADYLEGNNNPNKPKYEAAVQLLFSSFGDTQILFADYVNKINPKGKSQKRGIVITDKNIYKHDPKNYKVKKVGTPMAEVKSVTMSPKKDTFVVVHVNEPYRDFVLDLGIDVGIEKYSEFVTVLVKQFSVLMDRTLPVEFSDKIPYNNVREKNKPGVLQYLTFEAVMDPKLQTCVYKTGKNGVNIVNFPQ